MTYQQVFNKIKSALTGRPAGSLVNVALHEEAEISILNYIEQHINEQQILVPRAAHANATAGVNCNLVWNTPFLDTAYDFTVCGFDGNGYQAVVTLISKLPDKIVVKTLVNCALTATAIAY